MSDDLDADLYGDLYESQQAEQSAEEKTTSESQPQEKTPSAPETSETKPPTASLDTQNIPSYSTTPTIQTPSVAPPTQQIPTYEENAQPSTGYSNMPMQRGPGAVAYQNLAGGVDQRTVRPSEMKDEGKMFIGGLNWDTTDGEGSPFPSRRVAEQLYSEGLRDYFSQFGKVDACTIMRDAAGRSRCFAFLTFEDPASVNKVMVQEHFLDGKIIDPKRAIPREEHQRATKLFIGGLAGSVTSESMREFFSQFGNVIDSTVMLDRETGRSKGFGFISLEDTDVRPFLGFGNLEIDGKLIDVKLAQPRYQREQFSEDQQQQQYEGGGGNFNNRSGGSYNNNTNFQGGTAGQGSAGNMAFDPQALATLYTRMFQMANGGMGGMNMMGGNMGGMGGMGMMGGGPGMQRNPMMGGGMPGMGRGGNGMMQGGAGGQIPKGPRAGGAPGAPAAGMGGPDAGVGPQRAAQRGQHSFHPYARGR
ncbi:hypothetical protein VNI00_011513 [Paramarasmius palmivorus]|uniref:RRM domain-containing protein n=1 Tax=Paramarasmius palmivorus TaxID=297713 RepID=A0AAW0CBD9_9AGAR